MLVGTEKTIKIIKDMKKEKKKYQYLYVNSKKREGMKRIRIRLKEEIKKELKVGAKLKE